MVSRRGHARVVRRSGALLVCAGLLALIAVTPAGAATPRLVAVGRFDSPVDVTAPPGDTTRVFVVERPGRIQVLDRGARHLFLDLTGLVLCCGERGLLSMAFAPDYATTGRFYVDYTAKTSPTGTGAITVAEYRRSAADPDMADPSSARIVLTIPHDQRANHNGGQLQFGPDGDLYVSTGDGGGSGDPAGNGQNLTSRTPPVVNATNHDPLLGKLLRIDPRHRTPYAIPADNPFPAPAREVYAYGFRNPWRFSFDRATGDLMIGDVGQVAYEEVDFASRGAGAGANYGWNRYEGQHTYPGGTLVAPPFPAGFAFPLVERSHFGDGFCAITGGYVVRDPALPELAGHYVYGDYCNSALRAVTLSAGGATADHALGLSVSHLSSFGEDACGRVYATSLDGPVYRLTTSGACVRPSAPSQPGAGGAAPVPATISIAGARVRERDSGSRRARFAVTLSQARSAPVTVDYRTAARSARAPKDYRRARGTVSFGPGQTRATVRVRVRGDRLPERNERFAVLLSNPSAPLAIADGRAIGTIRDDDPAIGRIHVRSSAPLTLAVRYAIAGTARWRLSAQGHVLARRRVRVRHAGIRTTTFAGVARSRIHVRLGFTARTGKRQTRTRDVRLAG